MLRKGILIAAASVLLGGLAITGVALASSDARHPKEQEWTFTGPLGRFDQVQLQRGFKVWREVCSQCHSLNQLSFRNLGEKHGPFYDPKFRNPNDNPVVKAIAADHEIRGVDSETGEENAKRPGVTADRFPPKYPNAIAAAVSNNGIAPPDLSLIIKARHDGANYVYALLTGYGQPIPHGVTVGPTQRYNPYFPGGLIGMPAPLTPNKVSFDDGKPGSVEQMARDVTAFLAWASEPKQTERKQLGFAVMIYLVLLAGLVYFSYRRVWRNESH